MDHDLDETYQAFPASTFATPFWDFYKVFWEAERRFDLPFRCEQGVYVWIANRVRFYYEIASQLGLYDTPHNTAVPSANPIRQLAPVQRADIYVQTGATGPATMNRSRPYGCLYTERIVKHMLDRGARVLLVHDAPDTLADHPGLQAITTQELREHTRRLGQAHPVAPIALPDQAAAFWNDVAAFFRSELGVEIANPDRLGRLIRAHKQQYLWHRQFMLRVNPNAMICMAHYFRSAQIEAAKSLGIWTIDYQHGINSRYHLGYGYPHVRPDKRKIPYFPNEFWCWGNIWVDPRWFPGACCQVRPYGHQQRHEIFPSTTPWDMRPDRTLLVATSWAMQTNFRTAADRIATDHPDWTIRLKLHPRENVSDYFELTQRHANVEILAGSVNILEAAQDVRYVLSICSSSLFDVLLKECRIAVLKAPAVEYAEDFVNQHGVPVLEADGSNFADVVAGMQAQRISLEDVFHTPSGLDRILLEESLTVRRDTVAAPVLGRTKRQAEREKHLLNRIRAEFGDTGTRGDKPVPAPVRLLPRRLRDQYDRIQRQRVIHAALDAGIRPAQIAWAVRMLLDESLRGPHRRATKRLLRAVYRNPQPDSAPLHAEFFEFWLAVSPDRSPAGERLQERRWKDAAAILGSLCPMTARLASRYAAIAASAQVEYGDTRVSGQDSLRLRNDILSRLQSGVPFSMLRLGDGEVYAFDPDYLPSDVLEADRVHRETIWWGQTIDAGVRARLREQVQSALLRADMLGIPSIFRLLRDIPRLLRQMRGPISAWPATARAHRVLFEELDRLVQEGRLDWSCKALLDDRCHQELFTPQGLRSFLMRDRPRILVNCFTREQVNRGLGYDFFTHELRLPPHAKVRGHVINDALAQGVTPYMLDDLLAGIDALARDGAVFFVAGGLVGKALIGHAAGQGATALDIGAAADYWVGLKTRGRHDFTRF